MKVKYVTTVPLRHSIPQFEVSFPEKLLKIVTRGEIFSLKFNKSRLATGLRPDPLGELKRSPVSSSRNNGGLLLRGGRVREGEGNEKEQERERKGREGRGKEWRGGGLVPPYDFFARRPWRTTGTVSVNCSVYCRLNDDRTRKVFRSRRNISSDGASRSLIAGDRLFNVHFQSVVVP